MAEKKGDSGHFGSAYKLETNEQTLKHYRNWAENYDREVGEEHGYAQPARVVETLKTLGLPLDIRILDAGCGSGLSGLALAADGYSNIVGCDFSPEMLERAKAKNCYRDLRLANLNDGQPEIPDNTYDAITCVGVFSFGHVFPDACDDLLRILRPVGHLIIALNAPYWEKGDLAERLTQLEAEGIIAILSKKFGEHLPGHGVMGWVITIMKL